MAKPITVRATERAPGRAGRTRVIFDQEVGIAGASDKLRVVIRVDGKEHTVDGTLKVVKDAIERGELEVVSPIDDDAPQAPAVEVKGTK